MDPSGTRERKQSGAGCKRFPAQKQDVRWAMSEKYTVGKNKQNAHYSSREDGA